MNWPSVRFRELISQGVLDLGDGYRAKNSELTGDGPIFLRAGHVTDDGFDFDGVERLGEGLRPQLGSKIARVGDVVVTTKGWSTGRVAYVDEGLPEFVYSPHLSYWRSLRHDILAPAFLRQWSRSPECQGQIDAIKIRIDIHPYLSLETQRDLRVTLPPVDVQRAIGGVLGVLDAKIELNRRMNATLEETSRALFKQWFVDVDGLPDGWREEPLGAHVTLQRGNTYKSALLGEPGPYLLGLASIARDGGFRRDKLRTYGGESPPKLLVQPGELYLSLKDVTQSGDLLGAVARLPRELSVGRLTQDTVKLSLTSNAFDLAYLYNRLLTVEYRAYCRSRAIGTTNLSLSRDDFLAYPIVIPPKSLLLRFSAVESAVTARQSNNDAQSATLAELHDLLLPKLLSGELRIRDAERAVEAVA